MEDGCEWEGVNNPTKSWKDLKSKLCELRRQLSAISAIVPTAVDFRTLDDGTIRIFFLGTLTNGWETTLHFADVPSGAQSIMGKLQWQQLLEFNFQTTPTISSSSREEQLMLERKRLTTWGITSYELHPESGKIVFPAASTLYQCVDSPHRNGPLFPSELRTGTTGAKLTPLICPSNPDLIAFVSNCDIWVSHEASGTSERLTYSHKGSRSLADDPLSSGVPSYVIQEEFSRYQGCWWQPQSKDGIYRLLYEEVDDSEVKVFTFPSSTSLLNDVEQYRFPRAGSPNSKSNLKLIELTVTENEIVKRRTLELQHSLSHMFPWMEYVVRVGWTPDSEHIWVQLLDRRQKKLELIVISLENFVEPPPNIFKLNETVDETNPLVHIIARQVSDIWINVSDLLYILPETEPGQIKVIWAMEETGYRHLYLISSSLSNITNGVSENYDGTHLNRRNWSQDALTSGKWVVLDEGLWVDTQLGLVYFMALKDTPLERHLYVVSLNAPGNVRLLTHTGFSYTVNINEECNIAVATYSNIRKLPACLVFRITHTDSTVDGVNLTPIGHLVEPQTPERPLYFPELYSHEISSGDVLYAMVFKPYNAEPGKKYPTVLNVYGGPEVQIVTNTFKDMRYLRIHMLASQGYCVVSIDSRGSYNRGLAFESHIKHRMGTVELEDQIEMLLWLSRELGIIDMSRVAIFGWSYGGYLSLMGLAQYPDLFKVCIAGAPVTSWSLYDTGYTERYMDLPTNNLQGYKAGSILSYVHQFPDEENRLLIVHGLIDENVHFTHTSSLINQLVRKGKPYQLQVYPTERHSLRSLDASKHYETMLLSFLQKNL
ncbi:dipeptidyl peptidase 9 isoform X1 [Cimex lectularius]|uniref:Dipeptidyl peptidase 9 n=1 Tax=Cimex lectularius TaxID=79782 RepID=A0A8I6RNG0_CIMLE|nr:dipeptidyl peptidase 9 isoform X2 [Cimex lectularius]XP_024085447.1 dipeptidyl peptidase 9 isoform X1 [Cimex lectularius]